MRNEEKLVSFDCMRINKKTLVLVLVVMLVVLVSIWAFKSYNFNRNRVVGEPVDSLHGVAVYFNGGVNHVLERNTTADGYNLGLKYQCVEFVKRYYYEHYHHKMPDSYGHAKDFFDRSLLDGGWNVNRGLVQYSNSSSSRPQIGDIVIFDGHVLNRFGHVAIVSDVTADEIEIIQQNPGPFSESRERFDLAKIHNHWNVDHSRLLGWLRMP